MRLCTYTPRLDRTDRRGPSAAHNTPWSPRPNTPKQRGPVLDRIPERLKPSLIFVTLTYPSSCRTAVQFAAGVYTLLQYVPVSLGSLHQANALNLFTAVLALLHACRPPAPAAAAAALAPYVTPAAAVAVGLIGYTVASQNGTLTESERYRGPSKGKAE